MLKAARDEAVPWVIAYGAVLLFPLPVRGEGTGGPFGSAIPRRDVIWGVKPFVALMIFAVIVSCIPGIAITLADAVMGR